MPPNVLIVTTHDTGRFIEPYGVTTVHTPNLNRLAAEGARFNAYTTAPQCSPSRASLTTGRYPHANGTMGLTHRDFRWDLHPDERTIPQILRPVGYRSGHWGVEHAARDPKRIGNDVFDETRDIEAIVAGVSQFIDADSTRPFVVQVGFGETHRVGGHGFGGQPYEAKGITVPPYLVDAPDTRADLADFQGCVNRADAYIGRLLSILEDRGSAGRDARALRRRSRHRLPRAKCTLYDPGIEISLIARLPGSALSGGVAPGGMVSNLDVVPTLIELTGAEAPPRPARCLAAASGRRFGPPATPNSSSRRPITATTTRCGAYAPIAGSTSATSRPAWGSRSPATSPVAAPTATWPAAWTPRTTYPSNSTTCSPIRMN